MKKENIENIPKRESIYDWIRFLATILVVIGHSTYLNIQATYGGIAYTLPNNVFFPDLFHNLSRITGWIYSFHMPLFFALSGAVLALKPIPNIDNFIKSKIKRLLIPYFLYAWLFMIPIKYLGGFYTKSNISLAMKAILFGKDSGHLWFLPALFWCMISFVLIQKIVSKKTKSNYILLLLAGLIYFLHSKLPFDILFLKQGLKYSFWFALGYVFENERRNYNKWNLKTTFFALLILVIIEILNLKYSILTNFFTIICGIFLTYLLADICNRFFKKITDLKIWHFIVHNLFYIYLIHDPLEYIVLRIYMNSNLLSTALGCYSYIFSRTILIFILSALLGELINKSKKIFMNYLQKDSRMCIKQ